MSALGGGSADIARELKVIADEIRNFGGGLREAANALPGVGFAANTAAKSLTTFARDVGFGVGEDVMRFGTSFGGTALESNMLRAASSIPMDPFGAKRFEEPIEQAHNRLSGITGPIARAGGHVDMETKKQLEGMLYDQERRAYLDNMENDWLQGKMAERKSRAAGIFDGVPGIDSLRKWFGVSVR